MRIWLLLLFYVCSTGWIWGDSLAAKNKEAARLYKEGKVSEALSKWRSAQIDNPDNDKLQYNIGNGLHQQKLYEDAFKEYEKSLGSKDDELRSKAYYNMGNTDYRMNKLPEAIEDYKKCLEIDPKDEDAKYNIEFIEKKLKEQQKDQKQTESQKPEENKEGQEKKSEAQQEKEQQEKQGENQENGAKEEKPSGEGEEKKDEMSKEDAVRLLDAFKDDEKDIQKELRNQPVEGRYRVEKDW
ncbi:MAG: tetratricopeptide repeat protein [Candidatus Omnitrophota bacterium]|nr:tetratricopeptide repeat protein [Candidatus Omnitrophota bacterium]